MPQKKAKKKGDDGVSVQLQKVGGYAYTKKFNELQALVRALQAQAEAAKQQVEESKQREMVLLDLTVHQEQIISLFHHQILRSARQQLQLQQQQQQQALLSAEAAATAAAGGIAGSRAGQQGPPVEPQQLLQRLHEQLLKQVKRVQQQHGLQEGLQALPCSGCVDGLNDVTDGDGMEEDVEPRTHGGSSARISCEQQQQQQQDADAACLPMDACLLPVSAAAEQQQQQQQQRCHPASCSYVGGLLQAAATDEAAQQRVCNMTAADWSKFFTESFYKLLLLLELADRDEEFLQAEQQQHDKLAGSALLAGKRPARHSSSCGQIGSIEQQQQQQQQQQGGSLDAAAAAAGSSVVLSHMQQLEQLVDEWVTLSALSLILNPLPVYMACTINHTTQLPCAAREGHYDRVVRRMQLTTQQVRHFAAVLEEIGRLDDAVMAQGGQLARNAACPSTVVLAAEAERGAAAAAAAGGTHGRGGKSSSSSSSGEGGSGFGKIGKECSSGSCGAAAAAAAPRARSARAPSAAAADAAAASADGCTSSDSQAAAAAAAAAAGATVEATHTAAAAAGDDENLAPPAAENLLQRNVGRLPLHAMLLLVFNCNTLTRLQLAKCIVASYPFIPLTGAIAASAAKLYHQQQRHRQLQQQALHYHDAEPSAAAAAAPAAVDEEQYCHGSATVQDALHSRERHVLQQRRQLLDSQLQQWWDQLQALGLTDS